MNIEEIQQYCKSLPGVTEDVKWEDDLCFNIGGKMFAVTSLSGRNTLSFKVNKEEFDLLIETSEFEPAAYIGRYKWVFTEDFTHIPEAELRSHMEKSYQLIKSKLPKKVIREIENS
jgi:predicted DNA-binding protein (MmcQ/YjbR family)